MRALWQEARVDGLDAGFGEKSRLRGLLDHFSAIEDPRPSHKVAYPLSEVLLLAVCGTIADCDGYEAIGLWGNQHLDFLRRFLPHHHGVPTGRWLTLLMSRIRCCFRPVLRTGSAPAGRIGRSLWRSMERPRGAAMIGVPASRRSILFRRSPPPAGWCSGRRRLPTRATKSPRSRCYWSGWPKAAG